MPSDPRRDAAVTAHRATPSPDVVTISNEAADAATIPRLLLLAAGCAESGLDPFARRPVNSKDDATYWPDVSFGAWQQTIRWTDAYLKAISKSGGARDPDAFPGSGTIEAIGADFYDPAYAAAYAAENLASKWHQYQPDIFATLCAYNWPDGDGKPASASVAADYHQGITDAQAILGVTPVPPPTYNPDTPLVLQNDDWSCWDTSARMGVESLGRHPTEAWFESQSIADGIESTAVGLEDGTGAAGAAWLTRQYGDPSEGAPTLKAQNAANVSFDDVKSVAGSTAVLLGGHHWGSEGHWTFVRGYDPATDVLLLGNPAGSYQGIGDTMSRQQFGQIAPAAMVVIRADGAAPPPAPTPVPVDPRDAQIAALKTRVHDLETALADVCDRNGDQVRSAADQMAAVRTQFLGARPA